MRSSILSRRTLVLCISTAAGWIVLPSIQKLAAQEVRLSAITLFGANEQGSVNPALRWNTTYLDAAWDIAVTEGSPPDAVPDGWLNNPGDCSLSLPLVVGEERTFSFFVASIQDPGYYGLNLYFEGAQEPSPGLPGISVVAFTDEGNGLPPFAAIAPEVVTMGWPIADVAGAGTLVYRNDDKDVRVTLTSFAVYAPSTLQLDLVQAQEPGGRVLIDATDGLFDLVGQFSVNVERFARPLSDLVCSRSQDGNSLALTWTLNGAYDSIRILRDKVEIAVLAGDATSFTDTNVPAFRRRYEVQSVVAGDAQGVTCVADDPANPEVTLTALTIFGASNTGAARIAERWNTRFLDAAWDIALRESSVIDDPAGIDPLVPGFWLNTPEDMSVAIQFLLGQERTFSFYMPRSASTSARFGINLFFDEAQEPSPGKPGISAFALNDEDGPNVGDTPTFEANSAANTMGWPIASVAGAGTLVHEDADKGLRVTLTHFVSYLQSGLNGGLGVDLLQRQEPGSRRVIDGTDGEADFAGEFTLKVESLAPPKVVFHRGDADGNAETQLTDAVRVLNYLFLGTGVIACFDAADADDNGEVQLTDAVRILNYLFLGTGILPPPGPASEPCGPDPTIEEALECEAYDGCRT